MRASRRAGGVGTVQQKRVFLAAASEGGRNGPKGSERQPAGRQGVVARTRTRPRLVWHSLGCLSIRSVPFRSIKKSQQLTSASASNNTDTRLQT
jgi:hypothetical protein